MSQYKREITVAVSIAVIGVIVLAAAASYFATPEQTGPTGPSETRSTCCATTARSVTTTVTPGNSGLLADAVFNSPKVESQTTDAYYYIMLSQRQNPANASQLFVEVFVVKAQSVTGDWTTGYGINYTGRELLNVTVEANFLALQSTYKVDSISVTALPDTSANISFTKDQQQAIRTALSNSTVSGQLGSISYYVWNVVTMTNGGVVTEFQVQIDQVNGSQGILAAVDPGLTRVWSVTVFPQSPWGPFLQP